MTDKAAAIDLLKSLTGEWLKLPLTVMQDCGPASQTLGGLLAITKRETFVATSEIARRARLPEATVRKHLLTLDAAGWIDARGRQETRGGHLRRTATIALTKQTKDHLEPYGLLPWWACCTIRKVGRLPWSARAVLSVVMARLCALKKVADDGTDDDLLEGIENLGGDDRFRFSLDWLTKQTGLTRETVVTGKRLLNHKYGIVNWQGMKPTRGVDTTADLLVPNWDFRVVVTPAPGGGCFLAFDRGSESGQ